MHGSHLERKQLAKTNHRLVFKQNQRKEHSTDRKTNHQVRLKHITRLAENEDTLIEVRFDTPNYQ